MGGGRAIMDCFVDAGLVTFSSLMSFRSSSILPCVMAAFTLASMRFTSFSLRFFDEEGLASGFVASSSVCISRRRRWCVATTEHFLQIQSLRISRRVYSSRQSSSLQLVASLGTANCQLSNAKCITASVYPHNTQLLRLAVSPSNTLFPVSLILSNGTSDNPPNRRSLCPSLSTAAISFLMDSERTWKSSWACWHSRQ